ncbi:MAG: SDR family oxidoreductase [Acidimicrobiales bacterium]
MTDTAWTRALVTGASNGIGRALAVQLAAGGADVVLVARSVERLEELAVELRRENEVAVEVLAADLADPDELARVEERLSADPLIDLLVNNAGFGTYGPFHTLPIDGEVGEIAVNVTALVRLTRAALPAMVERGRGWVLNVSSMASLQPVPRNATYGATKAFVTSFSESVHEELRGTGVRVTAVLPGFTRTGFQERAGLGDAGGVPGFLWQSAEACAAEAIAATRAGRAVVVPGVLNKITAASTAPLPRGVKRRVVSFLSSRFGE